MFMISTRPEICQRVEQKGLVPFTELVKNVVVPYLTRAKKVSHIVNSEHNEPMTKMQLGVRRCCKPPCPVQDMCITVERVQYRAIRTAQGLLVIVFISGRMIFYRQH